QSKLNRMIINQRFRNNTVDTATILTRLFIEVVSQEFRGHLHNICVGLSVRTAEPEFPLGGYKKIFIPCNTRPINTFSIDKSVLVSEEMRASMNFVPLFLLLHLKVNQGLRGICLSRIDSQVPRGAGMNQTDMRRNPMRQSVI